MASSSMLRINLLLLFLARCTLFCSWPTVTAAFSSFPVDYKVVNKFTDWANKYGRVYKDDTERLYRLGIFSNNLEYINNFAKYAGQRSYTIGLNEFADLTNEEFLATHTGLKTPSKPSSANPTTSTPFTNRNPSSVPSSIDWRARGAVTRVKDQGTCGSCWAFSTVAAIEGITKIRKRKLIDLSEQELVDCVTSNFGCGGGWMDHAFSFIISNGGIATETTYPYVGSQGACDATKLQSDAATISGYVDVPPCNETALKFAVAQQPVSVAIDASGVDFQLYTGGIYSGPCGTNLDHAVTVVGYGKNNFGTKYWIVKNSWGTSWGDHGYIYMERDVVDPEGLCGISLVASYPIV